MADNTRSPEEIARLDARMAELDKYLKDPTMKLGRGPTGKFQFYKADQQKKAVSVSPKKTSTAASTATATKTSTPTPSMSSSPKMSNQYNEDTRTALQQLGPRRGVSTESITKPSAGDAAKIAAYKADQARQARNVEGGRDAMITAAGLLPVVGPGVESAMAARGVVKGAQAFPKAASGISKVVDRARRMVRMGEPEAGADTLMEARAAARNPRLKELVEGRLARREITQGEADQQLMGLKRGGRVSNFKKGGAVKPGKVKTVMHEFKSGKLKSGSGQKVTNPKQAVAIAMSEAGMKKARKFGRGGAMAKLDPEVENDLRNQEELRKARQEEQQQKQKAAPKAYAKGGDVKESKAMMKKEIGFMQRKGAPKSMIKHEKAEYGMKRGGAAKIAMKKGGSTKCYAKGGMVSSRADGIATKGKTRCKVC